MPFNRKIYQTNLYRTCVLLVKRKWRVPGRLMMVNVISGMFTGILNKFLAYRSYVKYIISISPQTCFIEMALNDKYDKTQRRIIIIPATEFSPVVLWQKAESKKQILKQKSEGNPIVLYTKAETALYSCDFIIKIPFVVTYNLDELRAFVDLFCLETKKYKIQNF